MKKVIYNYVYNNINIILKISYPLLTYPYIVRRLGVENIGNLELANSILSVFIVIIGLGIPIYGVREVSRNKLQEERLTKVVIELIVISFFSLGIGAIIYMYMIYSNYQGLKTTLSILFLNLILTPLGVEWFYQGMEEYKYITKRNFVFQIISLILVYLLIKNPFDYNKYLWLIVFQTTGSNILNFYNLHKYIKLNKKILKEIDIRSHLKSIIITCIMRIASTIYIYMDSIMIGKFVGYKEVGYYSIGVKLIKVFTLIGATLSSVIFPRLNDYKKRGEELRIKKLYNLVFNYIYIYSFPVMLVNILMAKKIILLFFGREYLNSVLVSQIVSPIILIMLLSNFIGVNVLFLNNEEKKMMYSIVLGASLNFILNIVLIRKYGIVGAAISTLLAETLIFFIQYIYFRKYVKLKLLNLNKVKIIVVSVYTVIFINYLCVNLFVSLILFMIIYIILLMICKEEVIRKILKKLKIKR